MRKVHEIPWLRICAESVAIVASILLAFGIDAWWDSCSSQSRTAEFLAALESEWANELAKIEATLDRAADAQSAIELSIQIYRGAVKEPTSEIASDLLARMFFATYKPSLGALNSVLLSDLNNVRDRDLRLAIASWSGVLSEVTPEQSVLHETGLLDLRRALARVALAQPSTANFSPSTRLGLPEGELSLAALRDEEFLVAASHRYDVIVQYEEQLRAVRETLVTNLELLRAH